MQESTKYQTNQSEIARNQEVQDPNRPPYFPGAELTSPESGTSEEEKVEMRGSLESIESGKGVRGGESRKERLEGSAVTWSEKRNRRQSGLQHPISSGINDSNDSVRTHACCTFRTCSLQLLCHQAVIRYLS